MSSGRNGSAATIAGAVVLAIPVAAAILAPVIFPGDPLETSGAPFLPPSWAHLMGTDDLGRDMLAAIAHAGRASLVSSGLVAVTALVLGLMLGVISGMAGRTVDAVIVRLMDASQVVPRFFLALLAAAWLGPGWIPLAVVLSLTGWASLARQIRAESRAVRSAPFIESALLLGSSKASIAVRHLGPIMAPLALPHLPLIFSNAMLIEAGLCFLGAGDPNRLGWGMLIQNGQSHALRGWWLVAFPGLALALASVGLTLISLGSASAIQRGWRSAA